MSENESTDIPLGVTHRLENPGVIPLELIEVFSLEAIRERMISIGNALHGDVLLHAIRKSYIHVENRLVAKIGMDA